MTSRTQVGLLVGTHFNPVGRMVLKHLPGSTPLILEPDPTNPYDEHAVIVRVDPKEIPESEWAQLSHPDAGLPLAGATLEQVLSEGPVMLGHVGRTGGKPLEKAKAQWPELAATLVGNQEMMDWIKDPNHEARLGFSLDGAYLVLLRIDEEQPNEVL